MPIALLIGGVVVVVIALFLVVVSRRPAAYRVERSLEVAAPADAVFAVLNDVRRFAGVFVLFGDPWEKVDAADGKLTIEESVPGQKVGMKLELVKPMASTAALVLTVAPTPAGGSRVTWSMAGDHNFVGKMFRTLVDTNNMTGKDLEKGLARLKTVVEAR